MTRKLGFSDSQNISNFSGFLPADTKLYYQTAGRQWREDNEKRAARINLIFFFSLVSRSLLLLIFIK